MIRATLFNDAGCPWGYSANPALSRARVALRRPDRVAARRDRAARRGERADAGAVRPGRGHATDRLPKPLRNAVLAAAEGARGLDRARLPGRRRRPAALSRQRVSRHAGAAARELHDHAPARRRRADPQCAQPSCPESTPTRSSTGSTTRRSSSAYERDKAEARSAQGTAIEAQGKASTAEPGVVRYTAPSIVFEHDEQRLVAGGWQPTLAYDLCIANLDPTIKRTPPPETPAPLLDRFPDGLTTAEIAELLAQGPDYIPDFDAAERAMVKLVADGDAMRRSLGSDPLWLPANGAAEPAAEHVAAAA